MYACAQRVRRQSNAAEGINAFVSLHGEKSWPAEGILPEQDPGVLEYQDLQVVPPIGNRVRSYLDLVAPDGTPPNVLITAALRPPTVVERFPVVWMHGPVWCRLAVEGALAHGWRQELRALSYRVLDLWKNRLSAHAAG